MTKNQSIRVRFAPSPTGHLHVGGLRTALYNFLFARRNNGIFILRIEDTDRNRYVEGATQNLLETLRWAGLTYDEGPVVGGPFGPYVQSERLDIYRKYAQELLEHGQAYRCFCSPERLTEMRKQQQSEKQSFKYDRHCLNLHPPDIAEHLRQGHPHVIRMKIPDLDVLKVHDEIRGDVEFSGEQIDDQVILKSDGYPTYHLANVIDDHLMQVTHVIRGEEWLSSTPKHVLLYGFFGWTVPEFAHLPLLLNPDRSKLSKRQGDVAVEEYRAKGYLREALINFIAFLGWNPGDTQEIFTMTELIDKFSLDTVNKSGAIFNLDKLNWLNFEHLRKKPDQDVLCLLRDELARSVYKEQVYPDEYLTKVIHSMRERVSFVRDFLEKSSYFFARPVTFDPDVLKKRWTRDTPQHLSALAKAFGDLAKPTRADFEDALQKTAASLHVANGQLIHPLRLALSGIGGGPGVYEILDILGKEESLARINFAINSLSHIA